MFKIPSCGSLASAVPIGAPGAGREHILGREPAREAVACVDWLAPACIEQDGLELHPA
jgi:hypothetical protein